MQQRSFALAAISLVLALLAGCASSDSKTIQIVNNQPFAIRMPVPLAGGA